MPFNVTEAQSEILRRQIVPQFLEMLDDESSLSEPAQLEQLAATLVIPLEQPEMPADVGAAVVRGSRPVMNSEHAASWDLTGSGTGKP